MIKGEQAIFMSRRQRRNLRDLEGNRVKVPGVQQPRKEYKLNRRDSRGRKLLKRSQYEDTQTEFLEENIDYGNGTTNRG